MRIIAVSSVFMLYILIIVCGAIFVYKDAKKRRMNQVLWTIVAIFGPFLMGVIIYLICRKPLVDLQCPKCGEFVNGTEKACHKCGEMLLTKCPECEFPIQIGWKNCPKCGVGFPENFSQPVRTYKKENGIGAIIFMILLAVLGLSITACLMFSTSNYTYSGYGYSGECGMYNITAEDLSANSEIKKWIDSCNVSTKNLHVLLSTESDTCILYVRNSDKLLESNAFETQIADASKEVRFYIEESEYDDLYGYDFYMFEFEVTDDTEVSFHFNGKKEKVEVTIIDRDISESTWRN